ncbi:hypothetical protein H0H93_001858, partial [Arthromyces matolae]
MATSVGSAGAVTPTTFHNHAPESSSSTGGEEGGSSPIRFDSGEVEGIYSSPNAGAESTISLPLEGDDRENHAVGPTTVVVEDIQIEDVETPPSKSPSVINDEAVPQPMADYFNQSPPIFDDPS